MAEIAILAGGASGAYKDAVPSALRFASWDETQPWNKVGNDFSMGSEQFQSGRMKFQNVLDVPNKKFFAVPRGSNSNFNVGYHKQKEYGVYKYDHTTNDCQFIKIDDDDLETYKSYLGSSINVVHDSSGDKILLINGINGVLFELNQSTGALTQLTTCPITSLGRPCCHNGIMYVMNSSKVFYKYTVATDTWAVLATPVNGWNATNLTLHLVTDGTYIIPVNSGQPSSTNYWEKYTISSNSWADMTNSGAPSSINHYHGEIFNGKLYIQNQSATNNYSVYVYNISGNSWTNFSLRDKGIADGGQLFFFRANNKMFWYCAESADSASGTGYSHRHRFYEMNTSEVFTDVSANMYNPVKGGHWSYNGSATYQQFISFHAKSNGGQYSLHHNLKNYCYGFRKIPYIDPINKTVEWIDTPRLSAKQEDWVGASFVVKDGKLYAFNMVTHDLWVCTIGTWTWSKLDNFYSRLSKTPWSLYNEYGWRYGISEASPQRGGLVQVGGFLVALKGHDDIYLVAPRYGSWNRHAIYKYDISADQWVVLNEAVDFNSHFGSNQTNSSFWYQNNYMFQSSEESPWFFVNWGGYYNSSSYYTSHFYELNPTTGNVSLRSGHSSTSPEGAFGMTLDGKPVWHTSSDYQKLYMNDPETMSSDVTNKYVEQALDDQQKYLWLQEDCDYFFLVHLDLEAWENSFIAYINPTSTSPSFRTKWGFYNIVDEAKGGYMLGWKRKTYTTDYLVDSRIIVDNNGVKSTIDSEAIPESVVDSATVFTTKLKKNTKMYLESYLADSSVDLVTYFAPNT